MQHKPILLTKTVDTINDKACKEQVLIPSKDLQAIIEHFFIYYCLSKNYSSVINCGSSYTILWGQLAKDYIYKSFMQRYGIYFLVLVSLTRLCAQNEASKWYFGVYAGLDFMTTPPTILTNGQCNAGEGSTGISDAAGNLLFYSDGGTIWNSAHVPMANGTGLAGSSAATQCGIVIKQPGSSNIYYIFSLMHNLIGGLRYSTIDMSLAAGMGSVTVKNTLLYSGPCVEKLAAALHCNGQDIWIVSHDYNNTNFRTFLVTSAGVNSVAVVSSVGAAHPSYYGQMKISPDSRKVAVACGSIGTGFEVFDFNRSTGVVSNPLTLVPPLPNTYDMNYGCEFSADGTKVYLSTSEKCITQWDLCAGSPSAISQTQFTFAAGGAMSLQLAPNGKIYCARPDSTQGVINYPDLTGSACNYVHTGQSVAPNMGWWGLPNFLSTYFKKIRAFDFYSDSTNCQKIHFSKPCAPLPGPSSMSWNFGDPTSGSNQSSAANPTHQFSGGGSYTVQLILNYNCGSDTIIKQIIIPNVPTISVTGNNAICAGHNATLTATGAVSYSWSNSSIGPMVNVSPTTTSVYTVTGSSITNSCRSKKTFTVIVYPSPAVSIAGNQTVCETDTLYLQSAGASNYTWSAGSTGPVQMIVFPLTGSVISVVGANQNGCQSSAFATLSTFPSPTIIVSGNNEICAGESTTLNAAGANNYQWLQYGTGPSVVVSPLSTTIFTVTGTSTLGHCIATELYLVNVSQCTALADEMIQDVQFLIVYPNPASNWIHVQTESPTEIRIHDVLGKLIFEGEIESGENQIDISACADGTYFISSTQFSIKRKFFKLRID